MGAAVERAYITANKDYGGTNMIFNTLLSGPPVSTVKLALVASSPEAANVKLHEIGFTAISNAHIANLIDKNLEEGMEALSYLEQMAHQLGFQMTQTGPFWFQRSFERPYQPGELASDLKAIEAWRRETGQTQETASGKKGHPFLWFLLCIVSVVLMFVGIFSTGVGVPAEKNPMFIVFAVLAGFSALMFMWRLVTK